MKHRISVVPVAGASTGVLLLVLAGILLLRGPRETPEVSVAPPDASAAPSGGDSSFASAPAQKQAGTQVSAAAGDSLVAVADAVPPGTRSPGPSPASRTRPVTRTAPVPARVGVSYHWAGGKMRRRFGGDVPQVTGLQAKTTVVVEASVTPAGKVRSVNVLQGSSNRVVMSRTLESVRTWWFERQKAAKTPGAERCRITITFTPRGK